MRRERKDNVYRGLDSTQHSTNCPRNNSFLCRRKSLVRKTALPPRGRFSGGDFSTPTAGARTPSKFFDVCTQVRFGRAARRPCPGSGPDRGARDRKAPPRPNRLGSPFHGLPDREHTTPPGCEAHRGSKNLCSGCVSQRRGRCTVDAESPLKSRVWVAHRRA